MKRREFVTLLGGAAAWPFAARATRAQPAIPVIGYLGSGSPEPSSNFVVAFLNGLRETGYVVGRNVAIEFRWARNDNDQLPELAADLVRHRVSVIVTPQSVPAARAAKVLTTTIPIVWSGGADPVLNGLVSSLNRPGGNVTGVDSMSAELAGKRLGLLHEFTPGAARIGVLVNPNSPLTGPIVTEVRAAASTIGLKIEVFNASTNGDIDAAFSNLVQKQIEALLVSPDPLFENRRVQLAALATRHAIPAIYSDRVVAEVGGLMSYGANLAGLYGQLGNYTGRILKGEKPADLPVQRATKLEFLINLQAARTIGIEVPPKLLALADEVIE